MEAQIVYVVYYTKHKRKEYSDFERLKLEKVKFGGITSNSFDSEQEALDAMIRDEKTYMDFVILKQYRIYNF